MNWESKKNTIKEEGNIKSDFYTPELFLHKSTIVRFKIIEDYGLKESNDRLSRQA